MNKEFVLVSQGIEIFRTKSQEVAINEVKKSNDDWFEYCQRCADNYENYADNYISLEIEYKGEEEAIRKDEREKIIDALWLSITDSKKIIFEKDGHKFELNLVPIINSEVE